MRRLYLFITMLSVAASTLQAQDAATVVAPDFIAATAAEITAVAADSLTAAAADSLAALPFYRKGIIGKIYNYFDESNEVKEDKDFDISFIGGPYYSSDTKFGLALVAGAQYRQDKTDRTIPMSNVDITARATTSMFFELGLEGTHIFPRDRYRLSYDVNISYVKTKFWGIGYDMDINDANESSYKYVASQAHASFQWRIANILYIGPQLAFDYINGREYQKPELWEGLPDKTFNVGAGFVAQIDTRDNLTFPYRGINLKLEQRFNPRFLANKYAFSLTELTFCSYNRLWRSGILATRLHARFTYGNTPWGLLSTLGGSHNMRGYFEGRFRDKSEMDLTVELRQHVWRRNSVVVWVGAGTVFPEFSALRWRKVLPNFGFGYRWEFKKRMNVRADIGFGRHEKGLVISINEAF